MIDPHAIASSGILNELGRIALVFGLIGLGVWLVTKLILRSGKRGLNDRHLEINRQQRRAERSNMKRKRRQSAQSRRRERSKRQ